MQRVPSTGRPEIVERYKDMAEGEKEEEEKKREKLTEEKEVEMLKL